MSRNVFVFFKQSLKNFFDAYVNIIIFLPYFFSVIPLLKTLFSPWKNIVSHKEIVGFSLADWFNRFMLDAISKTMGFVMRSSLLTFYILLEFLLLLCLPLCLILYLFLIPIMYISSLYGTSTAEKQSQFITRFVIDHLLDEKNRPVVAQWAQLRYRELHPNTHWWNLSQLTQYPPLARDWSWGYTPSLDQYTIDLTSPIYQSKRPHLVDRQNEISLIERSLVQRDEANALVVGDEGVGKHTIIDAFARKIYQGKSITPLMYKRILKLDMEQVLTNYSDFIQREHFFEELLKEATIAGNIILFIDDVDRYLGAGEGRVDLTSSLVKYAGSDRIQIIAVTTPFFYQKFILPNDKLNRLFTKIDVTEITAEEATQILLKNSHDFEDRYHLRIPYETIVETVQKSDYYISSIPFPEKAIALLDTACAYVAQQEKGKPMYGSTVKPSDITHVLEEKTHIQTNLTADLKKTLLSLDSLLKSRIIGQDEAVDQVASTIRRSYLIMGKRRNPLASFLLMGPTGVGKTETAKALSQIIFGSNSLIRFDMSMFQTPVDITRLVGSMESGNPGLLTSKIRQQPYTVLLLDEIEKAPPNLNNIFLTLLDEGYITDGYGKRVDCKNLIVVATSNAKSDNFRPEFLNRFDAVLTFQPLSQETAILIAKNMAERIMQNLYQTYKTHIRLTDEFLQKTVLSGYNERYGARDLERLMRSRIEDAIAKQALAGTLREESSITI